MNTSYGAWFRLRLLRQTQRASVNLMANPEMFISLWGLHLLHVEASLQWMNLHRKWHRMARIADGMHSQNADSKIKNRTDKNRDIFCFEVEKSKNMDSVLNFSLTNKILC